MSCSVLTVTPTKTPTDAREVVHLRVDQDQLDRIRTWAKTTHRTITGSLAYLIELGIAHEPTFPPPSDPA